MKCAQQAGADQVVHLSSQIGTFDVLYLDSIIPSISIS